MTTVDCSAAVPTVYVIDDDRCVLESIYQSLRTTGLCIETFPCPDEFLMAVDRRSVGCIVTDVRMPGMSGLQLQDELLVRHVDIPVIMISGHGDVPMVLAAMKNGAIDFLEKPFSPRQLREVVQKAVEKSIGDRKQLIDHARVCNLLGQLTSDERKVVEGIAVGKTAKEIAQNLGLSVRTIQFRRSSALKKLRASRTDLFEIVFEARRETSEI